MPEIFNHAFVERKLRDFHRGVRSQPEKSDATKYKLRAVVFHLLECRIDCGCGGEHFSDCPIVKAKEILKLW